MSIQRDILETIGPDGIETARLREAMGNVRGEELNAAVTMLQQARRVRVIKADAGDRYELISSTRQPPTAAEEAAASLRPSPATRVCEECKAEKDLEKDFSRNRHGPLRICRVCQGKRISASAGHQVRVESNGVSGEPIRAILTEDVGGGASKQPVIADRVFVQVKARRDNIREQLKSLADELVACDQFIAIYEKYAEGAT